MLVRPLLSPMSSTSLTRERRYAYFHNLGQDELPYIKIPLYASPPLLSPFLADRDRDQAHRHQAHPESVRLRRETLCPPHRSRRHVSVRSFLLFAILGVGTDRLGRPRPAGSRQEVLRRAVGDLGVSPSTSRPRTPVHDSP